MNTQINIYNPNILLWPLGVFSFFYLLFLFSIIIYCKFFTKHSSWLILWIFDFISKFILNFVLKTDYFEFCVNTTASTVEVFVLRSYCCLYIVLGFIREFLFHSSESIETEELTQSPEGDYIHTYSSYKAIVISIHIILW